MVRFDKFISELSCTNGSCVCDYDGGAVAQPIGARHIVVVVVGARTA